MNKSRRGPANKGKPQAPTSQFSQVYYQEKAMAMQSCQVLAQLVRAGVGEFNETEEQARKYEQAVHDAIEFCGNNIAPFVQPVDAEAANEALSLLQGKKQ